MPTILLVEDESEFLGCLLEMLTSIGYSPLVATSGEEALQVAEATDRDIDLLLTDIFLPQMKGHELADRLRRKNPDLKVMYISGYLCPSIPEEEVLNGKMAFLQKPFVTSSLTSQVMKMLTSS